jgi:lysophospholipase L1-like esterase
VSVPIDFDEFAISAYSPETTDYSTLYKPIDVTKLRKNLGGVVLNEYCKVGDIVQKNLLWTYYLSGSITDGKALSNTGSEINVSTGFYTNRIPVNGGSKILCHYVGVNGESGGIYKGIVRDITGAIICSIQDLWLASGASGTDLDATIVLPDNAATIQLNGLKTVMQNYYILCPESMIDSPLKGKTIDLIGDSISAGATMDNSAVQGFPAILAKMLQASINNYGVSSTTVAYNEDWQPDNSYVKRISSIQNPADLIVIQGGVNDFWVTLRNNANILIGNDDDLPATPEDAITYCGALNYLFNYIRTNFVGKQVLYVCSHQQYYSGESTDDATPGGNTYKDYMEAAKRVCERNGVPMFNMYKDAGFDCVHNVASRNYYTTDGTHLSVIGNYYYAVKFKKFLEENGIIA